MKQPFIFLLSLALSTHAADLPPPNFVVILGEAQGWSSMSVHQDNRNPGGSTSDYIRTPHLDSIALGGMRFSDSYAASPRCTPTRAALLTGRSPARLHMTFVNENKKEGLVNPGDKVICPPFITELPKDIETLGTLLKKHGYATAHFGKWHLGRANPREHGFDENDGANSNGGPENSAEPNPKQCYASAKLGSDFMSRQVQAKKPFYLQISHYPGKAPDAANPDTLEAVRKRLGTRFDFQRIGMAAGNEEIDKTIGLVLAKIKELGISGVTPDYVFNTWLCRPGDDSITFSILSWKAMELFIHFGEKADDLSRRSETVKIGAGESKNLVLTGLKADTGYFYQVNYRLGSGEAAKEPLRGFHTRRAPASAFKFVVQADSHLDVNSSDKVYQQTLANMKADKPDFMIDLGDTTMVDKFGNFYTRAESQYRAQRYYIGQLAHSTPVFLTLGNHDGEQGSRLNGTADSMPPWSLGMRKKYFPNPEPGGIYSGNTTPRDKAGLLQNYYSWEWGGVLFLVLDPFWSTTQRKSEDNWNMTLGSDQYRWLKSTLEPCGLITCLCSAAC
jgi:hypothetical protein